MTSNLEYLTSSSPTDAADAEQILRRSLSDWPFTFHCLREKAQSQVNEEYADTLVASLRASESPLRLSINEQADGFWICGWKNLAWDSDFFGFPIGRLEPLLHPLKRAVSERGISILTALVKNAVDEARARGFQQLTAGADPADAMSIAALEEVGFRLKDTLNYHLFDLARIDLTPIAPAAGVQVRFAEDQDGPALEELTLKSFGSREYIANRFNSDAQYPPEKTGELYRIWIRKSLEGQRAQGVLVAEHQGKIVAYLTAVVPGQDQIARGTGAGETALGAVDPDYHRLGLFRLLHKQLLIWFKEKHGLKYGETRTAITTRGVNSACSAHGSTVPCARHTFHIDLRKK